jgi:murein L,D-transpeptidase YcbB/YkuD
MIRFSPLHTWPLRLPFWGIVLLLGLGSGPLGSPPDVAPLLRARIEAARQGSPGALTVGNTPIRAQELVARHYQQTGFAPSWSDSDGPTAPVDSLVAVLRDAARDGLPPADYHTATIDSLVRRLRAPAAPAAQKRALADLDLLCTDAFFLYGTHLLHGRVDPVELVPTWTLPRRHSALPAHLQTALNANTLRSTLADLRPSQPEYETFRRTLHRYRTIADQGGWPTIPDGPPLKEGRRDERVPLLRTHLRLTGDLPGGASPPDPARFDDPLRQAVGRFQERHGLRADGVVGPATRAALNVPVESRIRQIAVNLERWRWLPPDLGNPHVLVNIADFWLRVVEHGDPVLQMRVVVGTQHRKTPVFSDRISYLVFNPYWHVPARIAAEDKLPLFQRTPALFDRLGYEAFQGWGADAAPIDGSTIDWDALSADDFPYRLRQKPGPTNALGRIKFMFPNPHDIYLHDTPTRWHFHRSRRDFSSGCIRVEHPTELAAYLLRHNRGWTPERIEAAFDNRDERGVILQRKVPIHLLYWTAWVENGTLHVRPDVYDRDAAVARALSAPLLPGEHSPSAATRP